MQRDGGPLRPSLRRGHLPETHNAFATHADGIFYPASNHRSGLDAQWDAGMRAFMLDTHYLDRDDPLVDEVRFCHGSHDGAISPCSTDVLIQASG